MMKKILWLSRHEMSAEQKADLEAVLGFDNLEIVSRNVTWQASSDVKADLAANKAIWTAIKGEGFTHVAGVFPPVALHAYMHLSVMWNTTDNGCMEYDPYIYIWSPVSKQERVVREDGNATIVFQHLRWTTLS